MAEKIKQFFLKLRISYLRSIFDMSPGELHYKNPCYTYPTLEEDWSRDWDNIGRDFKVAVDRFRKEYAV